MTNYPTYKLGEVADYINGRAFKPSEWKENGLPIVRIQNLNDESAVYHYSDAEHEEKYLLHDGDLLFAWAASLGTYIWNGGEAWLNQHIVKVLPKQNVSKMYLYYALTSIIKELYSKSHGSGMVHVTKGKFEETEIPLPPLPTQHQIVSRIETLFAELDKAEAHLRTAQQQLKTYRQAVLNHWLNNDEGKWETVKLKDICLSISDGDHLPPKRTTQGIPFITISDIKGNCIDYSDVSYMTEEYYESLSDNRKAQIGDILYTVTGSFGIPVMVEDDKKFCFQRHIGLVRPNPNLAAQKWLYYMMQSPIIYSQANEKATGTAQKTVTLTVLRDFYLPLPPLTEQRRIVAEIESRLSQASTSSAYIENALQQAEALRQSILKKAFSGELVVSTSSTTSKGG